MSLCVPACADAYISLQSRFHCAHKVEMTNSQRLSREYQNANKNPMGTIPGNPSGYCNVRQQM